MTPKSREALVLKMLEQGWTVSQAAAEAGVSTRTVSRIASKARRKAAALEAAASIEPFRVRLGDTVEAVSQPRPIFAWVWDADEKGVVLRRDGHPHYEPEHEAVAWREFFLRYRVGVPNDKGRIAHPGKVAA